MKAVSVVTGATPTKVCDGGNRDFLHMYNASDTTIYVAYDSDAAASLANLTVDNGMPIPPNGAITLDNTGPRNIYKNAVYAVHSAGVTKILRIQGAE